ncbi:MAG: DUF4118 domain-containing protein [Proteobacteria bacterium]|nr:DUF4118 domain-containing protein [Pseudomonadota bacterium]
MLKFHALRMALALRMAEGARHWLAASLAPGGYAGVAGALLLVAATTFIILIAGQFFQLPPITVMFLVPVLFAAVRWGTCAAIVAAIAGLASAAFFFERPHFSLKVDDPARILGLFLYLTVAVVTGHLAATARREAATARKREIDIRNLYAFSRRLAAARSPSDIYKAIHEHLASLVARRVVLFGPSGRGAEPVEHFGEVAAPPAVRAAAAALRAGSEGRVIDDGMNNTWLVRAVSQTAGDFGVIAVDLGRQSERDQREVRQHVEAMLADASQTLGQLDLAHALNEARIRTAAERFREALIGSVSHELRTPLVSILGAATVLSNAAAVVADSRMSELANVVRDEAVRLNRDIQNLLDASRVSGNGLQPKFEWADPSDIVNTAIERRRGRLAAHKLLLDLPAELPLIHVDAVLVEQALGQLLDNAAKYSPAGTAIRVAGRQVDGDIELTISDTGAGLTPDERARIGERFYRGARNAQTTPGSGLGLSIASAFLVSNGGRLDAESAGAGCGTTFSIRLPVATDLRPAGDPDHD